MKKTLSTLAVAAIALAASPAFAQASGSVQVTGNVAPKCTAVQLDGTIALGELAKEDGTVDRAFANATNNGTVEFTVLCNGSNPQLSVEAKPLVNTAATDGDGYTNTVHYTAEVQAQGAKGNATTIADQSLSTGATTGRVGERLKVAQNNVSLSIGEGITENSTAVLQAGTYQGTVDVTITATL